MLDANAAQNGTIATHQRARGTARVQFKARKGRASLERLFQSGSAKAMLPKVHGGAPELVFVNTAGGLTGGDHLRLAVCLGADCQVTATTQTAERVYASLGDAARLDIDLVAGPGSALHWLPQETILFDRATLARRTRIDLAADARLLIAETMVLGRTAMGERLKMLDVRDRREVYREGRLVFLDPLRLDTAFLKRRSATALLGDAVALGMILMAAPNCGARLPGLRRLIHAPPPGVEIAASAWDGKLLLRALASDAFALRRIMAACLQHLSGAALPRVWQL